MRAILSEWAFNKGQALVSNFVSQVFDYNKGAGQGRKESPAMWTLVLSDALLEPVNLWASGGRGCSINSEFKLSHLTYADNIWLLAESISELRHTFADASIAIRGAGLAWKSSSLELLCSDDMIDTTVVFKVPSQKRLEGSDRSVWAVDFLDGLEDCNDDDEYVVPVVEKMKVLGSWLDQHGDTEPDFLLRKSCALGALSKVAPDQTSVLGLDSGGMLVVQLARVDSGHMDDAVLAGDRKQDDGSGDGLEAIPRTGHRGLAQREQQEDPGPFPQAQCRQASRTSALSSLALDSLVGRGPVGRCKLVQPHPAVQGQEVVDQCEKYGYCTHTRYCSAPVGTLFHLGRCLGIRLEFWYRLETSALAGFALQGQVKGHEVLVDGKSYAAISFTQMCSNASEDPGSHRGPGPKFCGQEEKLHLQHRRVVTQYSWLCWLAFRCGQPPFGTADQHEGIGHRTRPFGDLGLHPRCPGHLHSFSHPASGHMERPLLLDPERIEPRGRLVGFQGCCYQAVHCMVFLSPLLLDKCEMCHRCEFARFGSWYGCNCYSALRRWLESSACRELLEARESSKFYLGRSPGSFVGFLLIESHTWIWPYSTTRHLRRNSELQAPREIAPGRLHARVPEASVPMGLRLMLGGCANRVHYGGSESSRIDDFTGMDKYGMLHFHAFGLSDVSRASICLETSCVGVRAFPGEERELPYTSHGPEEDHVESFVMQGHCSRLFHATEVLVADPLRQVRTMFILAWIATSCKYGGRDFGRC